ncbi:MAG: polysaccharide pyruvyl transferase CsaB [Clostridiales bacterium]|nr:polysaccharide pyruvyl transferase CsaB [Clostridiales bacterium]
MKILLATMGMDIGGAETHVLSLSLSLNRLGHDVVVASAEGVFVEQLKKAGIRHVDLPLNKRNPILIVRSYAGLKKLIQKENFDIVHAHARIPAFLCGILQRKYGFRFVTTCHFNFKLGITKRFTDWGEHVFSISKDMDDYLKKEYGIQSVNISRAVNGIDTLAFTPCKDRELAKEQIGLGRKTVILHTGRLDKLTSVVAEGLVDIAPEISGKYPKAAIVIVGDGNARSELKTKADRINGEAGKELIKLVGPTNDVYKYISASDLFVGPSRSAMEAMSSAVPTIVAGHQGYIGCFNKDRKQVCLDTNLCGRGNDKFDKEKLKEEILRLLGSDENVLQEIGTQCRGFIKDNYSVDKMTKQYVDEYDIIRRIRTDKKSDAVICGYYGKGNLGDELMLGSIVNGLRNIKPSMSLCVISGNPKKTSRQNIVRSINRFNIPKINKAVKESGTLILGGGNILQDKTSFRSLYYYCSIVGKAKENNAKVIMLSNGIGPIIREKSRKCVKKVLECSDYISLRDDNSIRIAKELCGKEIHPTFDYAISGYIPLNPGSDRKYIVLAPKKTDEKNTDKLIKLIDVLREKYSAEIVTVPFHAKEDINICEKLAQHEGVKLFDSSDFADVSELISHAFAVVSSRLHALVMAGNSGTPFVSVSDDEKLSYYRFTLEEEKITGKKVAFSYDFKQEDIVEALDYMDENREVIRDYILSVTRDAQESNEEELRNLHIF